MTISENNNKLIKDWIRPLQKSLTIETENKFINTLGREKYFNDYLHESLKKLDNLNLSDEYLRIFYEFSKKYNEYNKLDENQRKRLIIDTRKNLYKLGKTLEIESSNNISNNVFLNKADSNLSFDSDISLIKNVGKVYKNKLNELGIFHIKDLINLFLFPIIVTFEKRVIFSTYLIQGYFFLPPICPVSYTHLRAHET